MQHVAQSIYRYAFLQPYLPFFSKKVFTLTDYKDLKKIMIVTTLHTLHSLMVLSINLQLAVPVVQFH